MLSIIAILSDIPTAVLSFIEQLTGKDMAAVSTMLGDVFAAVVDFISKIG